VQDDAGAIEEAQRLKPDVVILNISMPVLNGLEAARKSK
jgi:CheY-like chemotaxis protein